MSQRFRELNFTTLQHPIIVMELFSTERKYPPGFQYIPDFLSDEEEDLLVQQVAALSLRVFRFHGYEAKRKVASFGYDYSFTDRSLKKGEPIPGMFQPLLEQVSSRMNMGAGIFAELLVTEYPPGSVINWHRDAPPFDMIVGISLRSDCTFRLRPYGDRPGGKTTLSFPVRRRSLYLISGESRTNWEHSTAPVTETRYSITLRTLRPGFAS